MQEWSGKESYEGYYRKTTLILAERLEATLKDISSEDRPNIFSWARENERDLRKELDDLEIKINAMWREGEAMRGFDKEHFAKYQKVVRDYGNCFNKILNRYAEAMKALRQAQDEREGEDIAPAGAGEAAQMGMEI